MASQPSSQKSKHKKWSFKRLLGVQASRSDIESDDSNATPDAQEPSSQGRGNLAIVNSPSTSSGDEKYGMFKFQDQPDDSEGAIDIVAVHGLGGHFEKTWTWAPTKPENGKSCNWLKDLLPAQIPNARIMSFGYNSAVARSKSVGDISTFGEQLLMRVRMERKTDASRKRPIIFVCHSLGGIVVKKALMIANEQQSKKIECQELLNSIKGILFMGTPHRGSATASLGSMAADMLKAVSWGTHTNSALIKQLKQNSKALQEISNAFAFLGADVNLYTFIETNRMDFLSDVIVTQDSARLNVPNEDVFLIDGNHSSICKFPSESQNYTIIEGVLREVAETCQSFEEILNRLHNIMKSNVDYMRFLVHKKEIIDLADMRDLDWFFTSPEFETWRHKDSEVLWLFGAPGSGKTSLSYLLWHCMLINQKDEQTGDIVLYVSNEKRSNSLGPPTTQSMVQILIAQILRIDEGILKNEMQLKLLNKNVRSNTTFRVLHNVDSMVWDWAIFSYLVTSMNRKFLLIIDEFDRLDNQFQREDLLEKLLQLRSERISQKSGNLKIFITSRPYDDIRKILEKFPNIERDKERLECLRTLRFTELSARRDLVGQAHEETCRWLDNDAEYTN